MTMSKILNNFVPDDDDDDNNNNNCHVKNIDK